MKRICGMTKSVIGSTVIIVGLYILLWGKSKDKPAPVTQQEHLNLDLEGCGTAPKELNGAAHPVSEK